MKTTLAALVLVLGGADDWSDFATLAKDSDPGKRCDAIKKIDGYKDLRMAQALLPLLADAHPRVRNRAMLAFKGVTDAKAVDFLVQKGLKHPDRHVRQLTIEALGWIKEASTAPALVEMLGDSAPEVRAQACDALAWLRAKDACGAIAGIFDKEKDALVRAAVIDALVRLDPPSAAGPAEKGMADKAYEVRMMAAERSPEVSPELGLRVFEACIKDADWRVRVSAIEAAAAIRQRPVVGALVEQLQKEKGRLRWDILVALMDLTEKDLGLEPRPWKDWWEANKDTFEPVKRAKPKKGEEAKAPSVGATKAEFFKVPILSTRILFILDLSGSMRDPAPGRGNATKLQVAKDGLIEAVKALDDEAWFGIIGLGSDDDGKYLLKEQKTFKRRLQLWPATGPNKAEAEKFVKGLEAKGWTNLWDAVEYGFTDANVDTIYLYSDGGASRGVFIASGEILHHLRRMNRFRKIVINTVEVPAKEANTEDNIRLLKDLATETKGVYKLAEKK
jgi:HEAT repeat protein